MKPLKKIYRAQMKAVPAFADKMIEKPNRMRRMMNLWPPLLCSGIKMTRVSEDWEHARIELNLRWWNANMHGAAFGGTLFSMTDVLFGTLIARRLGTEYEAWTCLLYTSDAADE